MQVSKANKDEHKIAGSWVNILNQTHPNWYSRHRHSPPPPEVFDVVSDLRLGDLDCDRLTVM